MSESREYEAESSSLDAGRWRPSASRLPANRTVNSSFIRLRIGEYIRMQMCTVINGRVAAGGLDASVICRKARRWYLR